MLFIIDSALIIYIMYKEPKQPEQTESLKPTSNKGFKTIVQLFNNKALLLITFSAMLLSGSQMILNTFIVLYAYERLGISLILAGVLLGIAEIGGSVGRVCWGIISDNIFNGKRIIVLLLISILVGFYFYYCCVITSWGVLLHSCYNYFCVWVWNFRV